MLLMAGGAAVEVSPHPGDVLVRVKTTGLKLDVPVEQLEALFASDLAAGRPEQLVQASGRVLALHAVAAERREPGLRPIRGRALAAFERMLHRLASIDNARQLRGGGPDGRRCLLRAPVTRSTS